ncbi:hypothetical protein GCM10008966_15560 [Rhodovulum strictum]
MAAHFVNISGGKDSTAVYLLALRRGRPFRAIMADTGHEHPVTLEYVALLSERTGGPVVEMVRADFSAEIARKRRYVETVWREEGVPETTVERALAALVPTGIPILDLCLWKGRFPSRRAQFCTEYLKERAVFDNCVGPALETGPVVQWLGVRRDESRNRAQAPFTQRVRFSDRHDMVLFRPLIHWSADNVFAFARAHRRCRRQRARSEPRVRRRAARHLADLRGVPADLRLQGPAAGTGKKRLRALAEWSFGGGERYCEACAQACPDCPARLNRPETPEGWQVWDLVGRLGGQLRVLPGAVIGWDMSAALALGDALGVPPLAMAELLPVIEAVMVRKLNEELAANGAPGVRP